MSRTIQIGEVFGETRQVTVSDESTLTDALRIAGMSLAPTQVILREQGAVRIEPDERVEDGMVYILTSNEVSGFN